MSSPYQSATIIPETMRTFASASLTGSYQAIGTAITHPAAIVVLTSDSTTTVLISTDGTNDAIAVPSNASIPLNFTTNRGTDSPGTYLPQGTQFYAKGTAGTGNVYISIWYPKINSQNPPL